MSSVGCGSDSTNERIAAVYDLKADPTHENREKLRELLDDPDRDIRATAVNALVTLGEPDAAQIALRALGDPDGFVRSVAAKLLGEVGSAADATVLTGRLVQDTDDIVRQKSAESLAMLGGQDAIDGLVQGLDDPMQNVRLASVKGLRKIAAGSAVAGLARLALEDAVWEIRVQAVGALGAGGDPEVEPVLRAALEDPNEFVRSAAANALRQLEQVPEESP